MAENTSTTTPTTQPARSQGGGFGNSNQGGGFGSNNQRGGFQQGGAGRGRNTGDRRRQGGRRRNEPSDGFDTQLLDLARVTRVTKGGRKFRFRATVITGDGKGKVGIGMSKSMDVASAIEKATKRAKKNLIEVVFYKDTIPHAVEAKFGASRVILRPQTAGRGLVAGGAVRVICEKAGIKNISAKFISRSGNKLNNAKATIKALTMLKKPIIVEKKEEPKKVAEKAK